MPNRHNEEKAALLVCGAALFESLVQMFTTVDRWRKEGLPCIVRLLKYNIYQWRNCEKIVDGNPDKC